MADFPVPGTRWLEARLRRDAELEGSSASSAVVPGALSRSYGSRVTGACGWRLDERLAELEGAGGACCCCGGGGGGADAPSESSRRLLAEVLGSVRLTATGAGAGAGSGDGGAAGSDDCESASGSGSGSGASSGIVKRSPKSAFWTWWRLQKKPSVLRAHREVVCKGRRGEKREKSTLLHAFDCACDPHGLQFDQYGEENNAVTGGNAHSHPYCRRLQVTKLLSMNGSSLGSVQALVCRQWVGGGVVMVNY